MADQSFTQFLGEKNAPGPPPQSFGEFLAQKNAAPQTPQADPGTASGALPHPDLVDQQATEQARVIAEVATRPPDSMNARIGPAPAPTLWQRLTAPIVGGMTGDVRAQDTPVSRALGGAQEPPAVSKTRDNLFSFENMVTDSGPGVARGAAEFASGLTSPGNLMVMAGTGGLGALESALGKSTISRLVSLGFSTQMLWDVAGQVPGFMDAVQKKDWPRARQIGTQAVFATLLARMGAKHALKPEVVTPRATETQIRDAGRPYQEPAAPGPPGPVLNREQRRAGAAVPETGVSEGVARGQDARERLARQLAGKPFAQLSVPDQLAIDELIAAQNRGQGGRAQKPAAAAATPRSFVEDQPKKESTHVETKIQSEPAQGQPVTVPERSQPAADAAEPAEAVPAVEGQVAATPAEPKAEPVVTQQAAEPVAKAAAEAPPPASQPATVPAERGPGWVGNIPTSEIHVDAPRFQFKANVGQGGAGDELREVTRFDPEKAGIISVWRDPADGKTYVVNGHHRVELAQRAGAPDMTVRYLNAETAQQARTKGAMINIAEGRGESTDAAKVFRDSGTTPEELAREGLSVKGKVAKEGLALSKLAQPIFDDVIDGSLTPARGAVIGAGVEGHADQRALYDLIKQRERSGKRLTNDQVEELIRLNNRTATVTESTADDAQGSMFGVEEMTRSLLPEKAEVSDYVRKQLGSEKKLFGAVGSESAAARLSEGGNVIDAAGNAQIADRANRGMLLYDKLSSSAGPIDGILDRAAQQIANGENANDAKQHAYRDIRAHVLAQADQLAGVPQGDVRGAEGHGGEGSPQADSAPVPTATPEVAGDASAVEAAKARLKARLQDLAGGESGEQRNQFSTEDFQDMITVARDYLRRMGQGFEDFSAAMVKEFGSAVAPHLQKIYRAALTRSLETTESLFGDDADAQSRSEAKSSADRLLGEQLTAQMKSGTAARPPKLKRAENRGLFDEPQPETGSLFGLFDDQPSEEPPPVRKNPERGGISPELLTLGAEKFWREDVAPAVQEAAATIVESADDILKVLAPQLRSAAAREGGLIIRHKLGELARRYDQAEAALRAARRAFGRMTSAENYEFIRRVEAGEKQQTPEFDRIAGVLRQLLDGRRQDVQDLGAGKLQKFYENYFPHIWEKPGKAEKVFAAFFGRRPLEGGKSFLKQRSLPTFADGLAAGLKPVSDNPVDLTMLKVREMDRYIMAHRVLNDWKEQGLAKFVDARKGKAPTGWKKIDDPIGTVYGQSVQTIAEYPNAGLWEPLERLAAALGIPHERGFKIGGPALGYAQKGGGIKTLHGTAEDTLAHEIGHHLDWKYGLADQFVDFPGGASAARIKAAYRTLRDKAASPNARKAARQDLAGLKDQLAKRAAVKQELRDLADLRGGPSAYVRSREEKMAAIVQAWAGAREQFQRVAPTVYGEWIRFMDQHPELKPLRDLEGGMTKSMIGQPYDVGGLVIRGNWYAPEGAARVLNNHLAPGLRAKSGAYRVALGVNNVLNQAQLGLSAFHLGFTSADAAVSKGALAIEQLLRGKPLAALKSAVSVPIAPLTTILKGNQVLREWYKPGSGGAAIAEIVDGLEKAGGRVRMDEFYQTRIAEKMGQAFRNGNLLGGLLRAPFAGVEAVSNVIMKHVVPRQKLGVFADLAAHEMERLGPGASVELVRASLAKVWDSVENRMGQMTYDNLFWDRTAKDVAMLATRSVGWNLGTLREIGGAPLDVAAIVRNKGLAGADVHRLAYVVSLAVTSAAMGAIYQYLATGKGPEELKDYYFPRNGQLDEAGHPQRMSLPTYVKDVYHYATEPGKTLANKIAPVWSLFGEMIRNKDFYGTEIRNGDDPLVRQMLDTAAHGAKAFEPFGFRNLERANKLQQSAGQKAQGFFGITPAPVSLGKSRAELLAGELAHDAIPAGARTRETAAKTEAEHTISRLARMGKPVTAEIRKSIRAGTLTMADARRALGSARLDPLQRTFHGLSLDNALQVWKTATPAERKTLRPMLIQKGKTLAAKTPAERAALLPKFREALRVH